MDSNPDSVQEMIHQLMEALRNSQETTQAIRETFTQALSEQRTRHQEELESLRNQLQTINSSLCEELQAIKSSLSQGASQDPPNDTLLVDSASTPPSNTSCTPPTNTVSKPASSPPVVASVQKQLSEKLPDPPMFTGKRKDLALFVQKLRFKLEGNTDRYSDERSKLIYAHSRLEKDAAALVMPLIGTEITTSDQLMSFLESTYGDRHKEQTAWRRLETLRQGNKRFLSHFAEFRRLVADTNLNEHAQIPYLQRTLSDELRRAMVGVNVPTTLNDYANLISKYDNDLRFLAPGRQNNQSRRMRSPDAMEIDSTGSYAPVGSTERQKRMKEGRCFKCGSSSHISPNCSAPIPKIRSTSHGSTTSNPRKPTHPTKPAKSPHRGRSSRRSSVSTKASSQE